MQNGLKNICLFGIIAKDILKVGHFARPKELFIMNFRKIALENERCGHVTKRLNRLNTWKFFQVLYRENMWRVFGFSFLVLLTLAPIFVMMLISSTKVTELQQTLPTLGGQFTTGAWVGVENVFDYKKFQLQVEYGWYTVAVSVVASLILSGGFAVIRDSFWTGKLATVGVLRSFVMGVKANFLYAFVSEAIIALSVFGILTFGNWAPGAMPVWIAVVCIVLMSILLLFVATFLLILCSVTVTYKQSFKASLRDAWLLMWLNILPNITHVLFALLPVALVLVTMGTMLQGMVIVFILMFGGLYFPLVWHSHMMRTFALFHPVETKKKGKKANSNQVGAEPQGA